MLLPYLDERAIFEAIDFKRPCTSVANTTFVRKQLIQFYCPSHRTKGFDTIDGVRFAGADFRFNHAAAETISGEPVNYSSGLTNGFAQCNATLSETAMQDGLSNTIAVGENLQGHWARGWSCCIVTRNSRHIVHKPEATSPYTWSSRHVDGAMFLLGDGSARFISDTISRDVLRALMTTSGGEIVDDTDY